MKDKFQQILGKPISYAALIFLFVYLFFTVIPNYWGCIAPENFCVTGVNKATAIITIAASLISLGLVVGAYNLWRKQKSAEVLASYAKDIYKLLDNIPASLKCLSNKINTISSTEITSTDEYKNFKGLHEIARKELTLFNKLLEDEKSIHSKDFNDFFEAYLIIDFDLSKVDEYPKWTLGNKSLLTDMNQMHKIEAPVKIKAFDDQLDNGFKVLRKIILHKQ